jgi:iron-sulfur cluster repair protein YtfE (RIC family)
MSASLQRLISHDHKKIMALMEKYLASFRERSERTADELDRFAGELRRHVRWEEDIIFPALERAGVQILNNIISNIRDDHKKIEELLRTAEKKSGAAAVTDNDPLQLLLEAHTFQEENMLYPWIDQNLSLAESAIIIRRMGKIDPSVRRASVRKRRRPGS